MFCNADLFNCVGRNEYSQKAAVVSAPFEAGTFAPSRVMSHVPMTVAPGLGPTHTQSSPTVGFIGPNWREPVPNVFFTTFTRALYSSPPNPQPITFFTRIVTHKLAADLRCTRCPHHSTCVYLSLRLNRSDCDILGDRWRATSEDSRPV